MFKLDIDQVKLLNTKYKFNPPLLDAGGLERPTIADYEVSKNKSIKLQYTINEKPFTTTVPHPIQHDRYISIHRPWNFIDPNYLILNPEYGHPPIEELPLNYTEKFNSIIMVSVLEHVDNPFVVCSALFRLLKPGGYLFNSTPFVFPHHPSPNDNYRFSETGLQKVHEACGFVTLETGTHVNYSANDGIGDNSPLSYGTPQSIVASFIFCKKPL